nr:hypothetical protein [Tanacetum cinerariifolium]
VHWELVTLPETLNPLWEIEEMEMEEIEEMEMEEMEMEEIEMEEMEMEEMEMIMETEEDMAIISEDMCMLESAHIKTF